jgi:xanthine dehydrogenase accessory factor
MKRATLDAIRGALRDHRALTLRTELTGGAQELSPLAGERTGIEAGGQAEIFVQVFRPQPRLIIVGAVHIAQKLLPMARLADFAAHVIDPREGFAQPRRFPDIAVITDWPDKAVAALRPDAATAVVTLTHDPKLDEPALIAALATPAFYVGALGSRKTHAARCARLREAGIGEADLARMHAPVGLAIAALSPGEIAVSIMAEIVAVLRGGPVANRIAAPRS